jgi:hypothetical protein
MPEVRLRQEVLNTALSELLTERGIEATPERVLMQRGKKMPDLLATLHGLRVVVEAEVGGVAGADQKAQVSAAGRLSEGIAAIGIALVYPAELASQTDVGKIKALMLKAETSFRISVVSELGQEPFVTGNFEFLQTILQQAWRRLLQEDVLAETVSLIDSAVSAFSDTTDKYPAVVVKLADHLGIQGAPDKKVDIESE